MAVPVPTSTTEAVPGVLQLNAPRVIARQEMELQAQRQEIERLRLGSEDHRASGRKRLVAQNQFLEGFFQEEAGYPPSPFNEFPI